MHLPRPRQDQRKHLLTARLVVYFVLAMTLYASEAEEVSHRLINRLTWLAGRQGWRGRSRAPSDSAVSEEQWP